MSSATKLKLIIISAVSGAGRSTAEQAFEDTGFRVISNLPISLWSAAVQQTLDDQNDEADSHSEVGGKIQGLVIGLQSNPARLDSENLKRALLALRQWPELEVQHIHLVCDGSKLVQRFSTTRRRHPFAMDRPLEDGIRAERAFYSEFRDWADLVIDTSLMKPKDLIYDLQSLVPHQGKTRIVVGVSSFAYGQGLPREADFIFDARFLKNPHYVSELRKRTGREKPVADYVREDPDYQAYFDSLLEVVRLSLPRFEIEGKSYLTVAVGCTGGRHRSVTIAEQLAQELRSFGYEVALRHRDS